MCTLIEDIAEWCHNDSWSHWMNYQFSILEPIKGSQMEIWGMSMPPVLLRKEGGDFRVIPMGKYLRWKRQANNLYKDLPEEEQKSDKEQAIKLIEYLKTKGYEIKKRID